MRETIQIEENEHLDKKLAAYAKSSYYPFHMPGHKRRSLDLGDVYQLDITEIEGFDNLHDAQGILKAAQERAAALYDSKQTYYLINGSTCGLLAAISAAAGKRKKILVARNCHKAVYHAIYLRELTAVFIQPEQTAFGVQGEISVQAVQRALQEHSDAAAVVITSPTYEGVTSDIPAIAEAAHTYGIPLIVDEAHGAHFGFHASFPETAVRQGADLVIQSMHKVLPSLNQTALLHLNSALVKKQSVERFLSIYQTSSPSYVLMAGMEKCVRLLQEKGASLFDAWNQKLDTFYTQCQSFRHIRLMPISKQRDKAKLVISVKNTNLTGTQLYALLLENYHLQMEMASGFYVLAMTSMMDSQEGFDRLYQALAQIDASLQVCSRQESAPLLRSLYREKKKAYEFYEAEDFPAKEVPFSKAAGKISKDTVYLYPPGIPLLLPGEIIEEDFLENLLKCKELRLNLQGVADIINERINIVNF